MSDTNDMPECKDCKNLKECRFSNEGPCKFHIPNEPEKVYTKADMLALLDEVLVEKSKTNLSLLFVINSIKQRIGEQK